MRRLSVTTLLLCALARSAVAAADPIRVRYPEGPARGFLVLADTGGTPLADGELTQWLQGRTVANRLVFRFRDGSLYDETVEFSQDPFFRLLSYRLLQKGPSFKETTAVQFDRSGQYRASTRPHPGAKEQRAAGTIDVPEDVSNGMTTTLLRNLPPGTSATAHLLAFTPEPQVIELHLAPDGRDSYWVGGTEGTATRFRIEPKVPGVKGVLAKLVGKQPSPVRVWVAQGRVPAFVRMEGPLYADGPEWRVELSTPRWQR